MSKYREILYGGLFGLGAAMIDVVMHATMQGRGLAVEVLHPSPWMAFYRLLYIAFGLVVGWLQWRSNYKERKFRLLLKEFCDVIDLFDVHAAVVYANAQALHTQEAAKIPEDATASLAKLYHHMQQIRVLNSKLLELASDSLP